MNDTIDSTVPIRMGQNTFGTRLVYALAALGVTEIDRSNRQTLDAAFVSAYHSVASVLGYPELRKFDYLLDPTHTSNTVDAIIQGSWFGSLVFVSNDNLGLLYITRALTPHDAMNHLIDDGMPDMWLAAGHAFKANVVTYSNPV
ncbi:hypothetical protein KI440_02835 [Candidatus Saccharibacteria bacterium TM7i]|nr:hypothetical protein KI440_02835 [Candidatus Saccharibacteria bacterium TM7i]